MKSAPFLLVLAALLAAPAFAATEACPFDEDSISAAPGEGNVADRPYFKHVEELPLEVSEARRELNDGFFNAVPDECLGMGRIVDTRTGRIFDYYATISDSCDGGNTFGIVIGADSPNAVADITDGLIECRR